MRNGEYHTTSSFVSNDLVGACCVVAAVGIGTL